MVAPDADADAGWRRALEAWSRTYYERCLEHPWITRIEIGGPPMLPNQIAWMDRGLAPIAGTGLSGAEQLSTILMLSIYAMSAAQLTSDIAQAQRARAGGRGASGGPGAPAGQASTAAGDVLGEDVSQDGAGQDGAGQDGAGQDGAGQDGGYGQQLARILDPARFPALSAIVATMELDDPVRPPDAAEVIADELHAEFFFGLDRMLDGVDVLVRARAATAG
jgi:hypothetical protein